MSDKKGEGALLLLEYQPLPCETSLIISTYQSIKTLGKGAYNILSRFTSFLSSTPCFHFGQYWRATCKIHQGFFRLKQDDSLIGLRTVEFFSCSYNMGSIFNLKPFLSDYDIWNGVQIKTMVEFCGVFVSPVQNGGLSKLEYPLSLTRPTHRLGML